MTTLLSREAILQAQDRRFVEVEVPEWGGMVRLGSMSAAKVFEYRARMDAPDADYVGWLLAACIVDQDGAPVFTADDVPALQAKSQEAVQRVFSAAVKLNVLSKEAGEEARGN